MQELFQTTSWIDSSDNKKMRYPDFAKRFKQACIDANLPKSGVELGKLLGVSSTMIYNYRNGEKLPSSDTLGDMARILNVSIDWLINGKGEFTQEELDLIAAYRKAPESVKFMISTIAESQASYEAKDRDES